MTRSDRQRIAHDTVAVLAAGRYALPDGRAVSIAAALADCLGGTRLFTPKELQALKYEVLSSPPGFPHTAVEVANETTLAGCRRLAGRLGPAAVAALNFASAKNPGGGFLNGSEAQEESLARSSGLYASLRQCPGYYDRHRREPSALYSDAMILSPGCPVFRADDGAYLADPFAVTFVTSAAPNAGAAAANRPHEVPLVPDAVRQRAELVLALAAAAGAAGLVLGAWGCGVFRNDPGVVAGAFADLLGPGRPWHRRFAAVAFSVADKHPTQPNFGRFRHALGAATAGWPGPAG